MLELGAWCFFPHAMNWLLLNSGKCGAAFNMALDEVLLENVSQLGKPVLRFYGWTEPAATFGYFQKFAEVAAANEPFDEDALKKQLWPDQATYAKEEQRRFEILDAHWDLPIKNVELDGK